MQMEGRHSLGLEQEFRTESAAPHRQRAARRLPTRMVRPQAAYGAAHQSGANNRYDRHILRCRRSASRSFGALAVQSQGKNDYYQDGKSLMAF